MKAAKELVIVESPTKARTIFRLLGQRMRVISTMGHIADLPKSRLGVDIEHGFEPDYIRIRGKGPIIKELQQAAAESSVVYLACDPDREGEAIAYSVANEISGNGHRKQRKRGKSKVRGPVVKRVLFYEITRPGLEKAFSEPGEIDLNKVNAHRGRRVLDRLVGYLVSPLLWKVVKVGLSAGRVQTVALRMIVEREREILAFKPSEYWVIKARFAARAGSFEAQLARIGGKKVSLRNKAEVDAVQSDCAAAEFRIASVKSHTKMRSPLPPFTTATLQQDAAQKLGLPSRRTMQLAQQLFEGVEIEGEPVGLITYPRTDSVRVADAFLADTLNFIGGTMEPAYRPPAPRHYRDKTGVQGAHEAIRPTRIDRTPESVKNALSRDQFRLYDLVYRRFLASQLADARYSVTEVVVSGGGYEFWAEAVKCEFPGFERVYGDQAKETSLPELVPGEPVELKELLPEQKFTQPPPRFTEATLIKKLESNGIGRPSTYATIVATLFDRKYVERKDKRLFPTELGMVVNDVLVPRFANVFETGFTREMEQELDLVEEGKEKWQAVVERFYKPLKEDLDKAQADAPDIRQGLQKELAEKCPKCGKPLAERWGRYGKFVACSGYPQCRYIKREQKAPPVLLDEKCPECGRPLVERTSRYGKFKACSGYPECKYVKKEPATVLKVGDKCPQCGKPLVERRGRFGAFVACSGYPDCKFMARGAKPAPKVLDEKCPECGKNLIERQGRFGAFVACSGYPKCKYIKKEQRKGSRVQGSKGPSGEGTE